MTNFSLRSLIWSTLFAVVVVASGAAVYYKYPVLFSETVDGRVIGVNRITGEADDHFVVAIRTPEGRILSARSIDARWALVNAGSCAEARFFPAPPWNLENRGSYERAMLLNPRDCTPRDAPRTGTDDSPTPGAPDPVLDSSLLNTLDLPSPPPDLDKAKERATP